MGWFNAARRSSMIPEHLVESAKLYDYYVNGLTGKTSTHTAHVHLSTVDSSSLSPAVHSAPSLMDLINENNLEPNDIDITMMEEQLFNHPDPYDLAETERIDPALQEITIRSSTCFEVGNFVRLDDRKLIALITNVDSQGPRAAIETDVQTAEPIGELGNWDIDNFL